MNTCVERQKIPFIKVLYHPDPIWFWYLQGSWNQFPPDTKRWQYSKNEGKSLLKSDYRRTVPSGCSLAPREASCHVVATLRRSPHVEELTLSRANKNPRLPAALWVNLEVGLLPVKLWDVCSPSPHLDCSLLRDLQPEAPSQAVPGFLTTETGR